jgi:hypothetical protein
VHPATGAVVGTYAVDDAAAVGAAVERAGEAALWWGRLGFDGRRRRLLDYKAVLARNLRRVAGVVAEETGKPVGDAGLRLLVRRPVAGTHIEAARGELALHGSDHELRAPLLRVQRRQVGADRRQCRHLDGRARGRPLRRRHNGGAMQVLQIERVVNDASRQAEKGQK